MHIRLGDVSFRVRKAEKIRAALIRTHQGLGATLSEARSRAGQTLGRESENLLRKLMVSHLGAANVAWLNASGAQPEGDFIAGNALVEVKSTFSDNGKVMFNMEPAEIEGHRRLAAALGATEELCLLVVFHRDSTFHVLSAAGFGYHNPKGMRLVGHYCSRCQKGRQKWKRCTHATGDKLAVILGGIDE